MSVVQNIVSVNRTHTWFISLASKIAMAVGYVHYCELLHEPYVEKLQCAV